MTISISIVAAVVVSIIAWILIFIVTAMLMFGNDRAFPVAAVVATVIVALYWLHSTGIMEVVP